MENLLKMNPDNAKRILIKIGTATITKNEHLDKNWMREKVHEIAGLQKEGREIIIVSSGAVGAGMSIERLHKRPSDLLKLQLLSGKGQPVLHNTYREFFAIEGIQVIQVLLTHHNFSSADEEGNIRNVINGALKEKTIPIINTNDVVTKEEFTGTNINVFTDNDELAALVAANMEADLLLILTDVEGLYSKDPKQHDEASLIHEVSRITPEIEAMAKTEKTKMGMGGMYSKIQAAKAVAGKGIFTIVANGCYSIKDILSNKAPRTLFIA